MPKTRRWAPEFAACRGGGRLAAAAGLLGGAVGLSIAWAWLLRIVLRTGWAASDRVVIALVWPGWRVSAVALVGLALVARRVVAARRDRAGLFYGWLAGYGLLSAAGYLMQRGLPPHAVFGGLFWQVGVPALFLAMLGGTTWSVADAADGLTRPPRRRLGAGARWALFFVLVLAPSLWFAQPWSTWFYRHRHIGGDEPRYLLVTHSLAHDLDFNLFNNYTANHRARDIVWSGPYEDPGDLHVARRAAARGARKPPHTEPQYWTGRRYGIERLGLPLLLAPGYRIGYAAGRRHRFGVVLTLNAILAGTMLNIYLLAWRLTRHRRAALLAALAGGLSAPLMLFGVTAYTEPVGAFLLAFALRTLTDLSLPDGRAGASPLRHAGLGAVIAYLPWVHEKMFPLALALLVLYGIQARPRLRRAAWVAAPLALSLALQAWYYWTLYGRWTPAAVHGHPFRLAHLWETTAFWGVLFDQKRGLLPAAPWAAAGLAGLWIWARRGPRTGIGPLVMTAAFLVTTACFGGWYGGGSPQPRYVATVMPLLAVGLAVAWADSRSRAWRAFMLGSSLLGAAQGVVAVATGHFLSWHRTAWLQDLFPSVFFRHHAEWIGIGAWTVMLAWMLWRPRSPAVRRRMAWAPVLALAAVLYAAGARVMARGRPIMVRNRVELAETIADDMSLETLNGRIRMLRWMRGAALGRRIALPAAARIASVRFVAPPWRVVDDPAAGSGSCARWEGVAATGLDLPISGLMTLFEGPYRVAIRLRGDLGVAAVADPDARALRLVLKHDLTDLASLAIDPVVLDGAWHTVVWRLDLPDVARHVHLAVRVMGAGHVAVDDTVLTWLGADSAGVSTRTATR